MPTTTDSLHALTCDQLVDALREVEATSRRLAAQRVALIAELDARGAAGEKGFNSTTALVSAVCRVDPRDAGRSVTDARMLATRRAMTGESLPPLYPVVASACVDGDVSLAQARVITTMLERLPDAIDMATRAECERFLTEQARLFEPRTLAGIAIRMRDTIDPDGILTEESQRERQRGLSLFRRADGSATMRGELTAICAEALLTTLDGLARPAPAEVALADPRTPAQRRHDGLQDALLAALRSGTLPRAGGVAATIVLSMSSEQAASGEGVARTGHGAFIPVRTALSLAGDAQLQVILRSKVGAIEGYSGMQRLFVPNQRYAMVTRDGGCSFPGCTMPASWCEAAHVVAWADGGPTTVANGTLLCGYHHRYHEKLGWTCRMNDGIPEWTPPLWIDPTQTPRRNYAHAPPIRSPTE